MNIQIHDIRRAWLFYLILPLLALTTTAGAKDLVTNSPFLPEGYVEPRPPQPPVRQTREPPRGPQPLDQVEFRGLTQLNGEIAFSLFDPTENRSFWVGVGQSEAGFSVVEFDDREDAVIISHGGNTRTVALRESQVAALPDPAPPQQRGRQQGGGQQRPAQVEDPEQRMQNLAEEIRQRREARRTLIEEAEARQGGGGNQPQRQVPQLPQ